MRGHDEGTQADAAGFACFGMWMGKSHVMKHQLSEDV